MKSRAMVLQAFNQPLVMQEIEISTLSDGQVLVKLEASGVCGSDVHMHRGEDSRNPLPMILGHEGVGKVIEVKGNKQTVFEQPLKPGDRVIWNRGISCGGCYACAVLHEPWLCQSRKTYGINRPLHEAPYINGCYSEYIVLEDRTDIFRIDEEIDPAVLVTASCSGATVAHAFDTHPARHGDTVLVQGPGPLGLYATAFAKKMGADQVIMIGGSDNRLALCEDFGATRILNRKTTSLEERREIIMELTGGRGVDMAVEAVGDPSAVHEGLKLVRSGGAYLSIGFSQPPGLAQVDFFQEVVKKNLKIQGIWVSSNRHTYQAVELVRKNAPLFSKMITHRFPLSEANQALAAMANRDALKAVLVPE